ncbi:MAG: SGNH/GDSL hydrolase family protein [Microcoleaceae cyanobacterium]
MSINPISPKMTVIQSNHPNLRNSPGRFNQIYIFGDSLSDPGNLFTITDGTTPANPPYPQQRFSNGLVWCEYFTPKLGLNPQPFTHSSSAKDGINFAVGGATTGDININGATLPSLQQQINTFVTRLNQTHQQANPNALYIVWAGANDYLGGQITNPADPVSNLSQAIELLYQVGARYILVFNLPELGDTPIAQNSPEVNPTQLYQLSNTHNTLLKTTVEQMRQSLRGIQLGLMDIQGLFKRVIANPRHFDLTNVTDSCLVVACCDAQQYLFWDQLHPTTTAHRIIAEAVFSILQSDSTNLSTSGNKLTVVEELISNQRRA